MQAPFPAARPSDLSLVNVCAPARALPPDAFRSLAFAHREDLAIWTRDWVCVGTLDEIPAAGDLLPFTVGAHGVHVQRADSGLVARFNKAQHGGCRQVPVQCQTGTKTRCSFTSCGHSRDRAAIPADELGDGTPAMHQYLGLRPERLLTAQLFVWGPFLFVNLNPQAKDVGEALAPLAARMLPSPSMTRRANFWTEPKANWKLAAQALLSETSATDDVAGDEESHWFLGRDFIAGEPEQGALVFPNLVLLARSAELCAIVLQPTALGRTLLRVSVYGATADAGEADWRARLSPRLRQAESDQVRASQWGTSASPETIGADFPPETRPHGAWMQALVSRRMAALDASAVDLQTFQLTRP